MRFYRPADAARLELPRARLWFFFLGPFYLLWLRLWLDAVVVAGITWALVHGTLLVTRNATGGSAEIDFDAAFATLNALQTAGRSPQADAAFQQLMATLVPFYAAGLMLLVVMLALTSLLPRYLAWRYGRRGWRPVQGAAAQAEMPVQETR